MESNILDELLNKIKSLERQNTALQKEIEIVNEKLREEPKEEVNIEDGKFFL